MENTELTKEYIVDCIENIEIVFQDEIVNISNIRVKECLERENIIRLRINSAYINSAICNKHKDKSKINRIKIHKSVINKQDINNLKDYPCDEVEEFIFDECYIDRIIMNNNWNDDDYSMYFEISGRYINE